MVMNDIIMWIIIGVVGAAVLAFLIYWIVKICKMKPAERKKLLVTYLKGAVAAAEKEIGAGHGEDKLKEVEDYFNAHASWFLKILLLITGKDNLKELIDLALKEIKESFGNK